MMQFSTHESPPNSPSSEKIICNKMYKLLNSCYCNVSAVSNSGTEVHVAILSEPRQHEHLLH